MPKNNLLNKARSLNKTRPRNKTQLFLFTLLLPLFLLLLSYQLTIVFYPLVPYPLLTPLTPYQQNTLDFLQGRIEATALTVPYTPQELSHLADVKQVMQWVDTTFILLLLATLALLYHSKAEWKKFVRWGGMTTVALVSLIILSLLLSFNTVFTLFHLLFFPQGNWIFPADSLLIQTFPLAFFVRMGMIIFGVALGMGMLLILVLILIPKIKESIKNSIDKNRAANS